MGNQPMTIGLKVNTKGPHLAGSIVYGNVYLSVSRKPQEARSIQLRVIGKEELVVHHTSERNDHHHNHGNHRHGSETHTEDHHEHSTHDILQMEYPLRVFPDGKIPVGQYEFPFALQLPENLPSTMSCRKGQSSCEVKFEIMAEVYQQPNTIFHTNPNAKEDLVIEASTETTRHHDTSLTLPPEMIPVTGCCCSKKGSMSLETKFDKTTVQAASTTNSRQNNQDAVPLDAFSIEFRGQNRSTVNVERVRVQLTETIEWTSNGYQEQMKTVLAKMDLDGLQFPELDRIRKRDLRRIQRREYFGTGSNEMLSLQRQPWHTVGPLQVPRHAKDSYHGRAIQIRHVLSVEFVTKGCCMSNPDASTIVQIFRRLADSKEGEYNEYSETMSTPSAPFEDEPSLAPSAPSEFYDETPSYSIHAEVTATPVALATAIPSSSTGVLVEAQALPPDWNAQTAEIVTIPMAEAIVLGPS